MDWRAIAERLYSGFEWSRFENTCDSELSGQRARVAFSGGADSLLLLLLVFEWQRRSGKLSDLQVLHFNHCLRGADSDEDARFSKEVCESLGLEFFEGIWRNAPASENVSEDQAREARMDFFSSIAGESTIVTGHHQDDIIETILMRLSRGAGVAGLSAPRRVSVGAHGLRFVRPLLDTRKIEIVAALKQVGAVWREDGSNFGDQYYRNRLRQNVIELWEGVADRPVAQGVAYSRELLEEDAAVLEAYFEKEWARISEMKPTKYSEVRLLPVGFRRRFLARLVESRNLVLSRSAMEVALNALADGEDFAVSVSDSTKLIGSLKLDRVELGEADDSRSFSVQLAIGSSVCLPGGARVLSRLVEVDEQCFRKVSSGAISHDHEVYLAWSEGLGTKIRLRNREAGDAYRPFGKSSPTKLKDLLIDRKIERERRDDLPVVTAVDGTILWVPGLPPNYDLRLDDGTVTALQLTYEK